MTIPAPHTTPATTRDYLLEQLCAAGDFEAGDRLSESRGGALLSRASRCRYWLAAEGYAGLAREARSAQRAASRLGCRPVEQAAARLERAALRHARRAAAQALRKFQDEVVAAGLALTRRCRSAIHA